MGSRRSGSIAIAGIVLSSFFAIAGAARAQDASAGGADLTAGAAPRSSGSGWAIERVDARASVFYQDGLGWQSQAGPQRHGPGSQELIVVQPMASVRVRQDENVWHDVTLPVDIVSAASPDALDAISSASRDNESFTLDGYSHVRVDPDTVVDVHWGGHIEELLRAGWLGFGIARELADDNAVLQVSTDLIFDWLDPVWPNGYDPKAVARWTGTVNASLSQLLSPTTMVQVAYGFTAQMGTLATTWNSVPWEGHDRIQERLPTTRARHAGTFTLRQAIPESRTFGEVSYRLYVDDFGIVAHTAQLELTQYLSDDVWVRGRYRFYAQSGASFWTDLWPDGRPDWLPRTADSDLGAFFAHEAGASVRWFYEDRGVRSALRSSWLELSYVHYERTDGLHVDVGSLGWGQAL